MNALFKEDLLTYGNMTIQFAERLCVYDGFFLRGFNAL
jgi:hypothetical protein